jgi:hypothetical protein
VERFIKAGFMWQFASGFVLGAVALVAVQPSDGRQALADHFRPSHAEVR